MVYLDSWWPYILVGISFFAFFVLIIVLCRHRLHVCPPTRDYGNGYPSAATAGDPLPRDCHQGLPAMGQSPSAAAAVAESGGFHMVAEVTTFSTGGSPVDVIILPPPYSDQAPPSYSDAIKTYAASLRRTTGDQSLDRSRTS